MTAPHIDHMGIIVDDLDRSIGLFERLFHLKPFKITAMPEVGLKIAQLRAENILIELIQYTARESFAQGVMGPKKGVNHFAVRVRDIKATLRDFDDKGVKVMEGFPTAGSHGTVAFFETDTTEGILLEVCEV